MCTAITYKKNYFGRNLDLDYSYNEGVTVTPGNYPLKFRKKEEIKNHYAIIGMAVVEENYPLYFDGMNEYGVAMAGLTFHRNLCYREYDEKKDNITPFEFIPWVLAQCKDMEEVKRLLKNINILNMSFSDKVGLSPLHWIISDKESAVTVEATESGVMVYDNPVGVLTNDPGFDMQLFNLNNYMGLTAKPPQNRFSEDVELFNYCKGLGAVGLPGDLSSMSRFVKATFTKLNSVSGEGEDENVSQFFHILCSVYQQRGCVITEDGKYEITRYSSCMSREKGIYYYTTYENCAVTAVDINRVDKSGSELITYRLMREARICYQN